MQVCVVSRFMMPFLYWSIRLGLINWEKLNGEGVGPEQALGSLDCSHNGVANLPGPDWLNGFLAQHANEISRRRTQSVGKAAACVTYGQLEAWFKGVVENCRKIPGGLDALMDPRRKFNSDETGCPLDMKTNRFGVLGKKGSKQVYQIKSGSKTQITVNACFNANGDIMPPFMVFPGQRVSNVNFTDFREAYRTTTENGWMDADTFILFLERVVEFAEKLKTPKPYIHFFGGHTSLKCYAANHDRS